MSECITEEEVVFDDFEEEEEEEEEEETFPCSCCSEEFSDEDSLSSVDGGNVCQDCLDDHYFYCDDCEEYCDNESHNEAKAQTHGWNPRLVTKHVCDSCLRKNYTRCGHCHEYHSDENMYGDGFTVCESCYQDEYSTCYSCEGIFTNDSIRYHSGNEESYCESCYPAEGVIHSYGYTPDLKFHAKEHEHTKLYYGIELEVDVGGEISNNAKDHVLDILGEDFVYCKEDGSLDSGFEIVTHPATYEFHMGIKSRYALMMQRLVNEGDRSHDTESCGFHIHISKNSFGDDTNEVTFNISKFLFMIEKFYDQILIFSRRTESKMSRWAKRYGIEEHPSALHNKAVGRGDRFHIVNFTNSYTVEVRAFRGTLKINTFIATIQLLHVLHNMSLNLSMDDVMALTWNNLVENTNAYEELSAYLKKMGIGITETHEMLTVVG